MTIGSPEEDPDVVVWGFVTEEKKLELMSKAKALIFPSVREGWGLIISEAAAVGTPSVVFDAPGTRDAVDFGNAGYLCGNQNVEALSEKLFLTCEDDEKYKNMQIKAFSFAFKLNWKATGEQFSQFLNALVYNREVSRG